MKTYFIEIEDCQNNTLAIVKVNANTREEADNKALRAIHSEDTLYALDESSAKDISDEYGVMIIDEDGEEVDMEEEDDE